MEGSGRDLLVLVCGIYVAGRLAVLCGVAVSQIIRKHIIRWICRTDLVSTYGSWAAVTGASSGIGLGLAKGLASQGLNIVLISRSLDKLQSVAYQIEKQYGVKTKTIVSEATNRDTYPFILEQLTAIDIGILVNNIGIISEENTKVQCFHEGRTERVYDMNSVNCGAATLLMKGVLPQMMKRRRGLIVNLTSFTSLYPIPYQAQYSATKIYLDLLGCAVNQEIKGSGVKVKTLKPFVVQTQMTAVNNFSYYSPVTQTPRQYATSVIPTLASSSTTCGFWLGDLAMWLLKSWPEWLKYFMVTTIMNICAKYGKVVSLKKY